MAEESSKPRPRSKSAAPPSSDGHHAGSPTSLVIGRSPSLDINTPVAANFTSPNMTPRATSPEVYSHHHYHHHHQNNSLGNVGPVSAPSSPKWRRRRLLGIGADVQSSRATLPDETSLLSDPLAASYGSLPPTTTDAWKGPSNSRFGYRIRNRGLPFLSMAGHASEPFGADNEDDWTPRIPFHRVNSHPSSFFSSLRRRPLSAYDAMGHNGAVPAGNEENEEGARINGIRVWYSSFTSIDWLHDAIKDSARTLRLRKRRSLRGRLQNAIDRSIGWFIVAVVGFLTAIVAFLIIRFEQLLFDYKEGFCADGAWKAKRFCCPLEQSSTLISTTGALTRDDNEVCPMWKAWSDVLGPSGDPSDPRVWEEDWFIEYASYTLIALTLASLSSLMTIKLTASTSFFTRKESGVLAPAFSVEPKALGSSGAHRRKVLYFAAGSGIPEIKTILSGFVIHGYLGARTLFAKSVGLALSVASGLTLGKEGPFVHIASCVGNIISRWFMKYETNEGKRREILSAAAAAGVAVAFGAPIGGVLFSLEEVSYFFPPKVMWRSFFCAMLAAATLGFLDPFGTGKLVLFQVTYDKDWRAYELVPFLFLGILGGVYGAYFSKLNYRWSKHVRNGTWLKTHPVSEVLLITLVTSVLGFLNLYTRMGGTELVYNLFAECTPDDDHSGLCVPYMGNPGPVVRDIALALLVKGALTVVTFGIKLPAGIFIPSLGVGACAGRIVGLAVQYFQWRYPHATLFKACGGEKDCVIPGIYAMVGAAATLSGVTRTTVSLAVIMFELTNSLTYVVPIMLSVLVAKTVADAIESKGIYDLVIELSQLPYLDHKQEYLWGARQVHDVADHSAEVIRINGPNTVRSLRDQLQAIVSEGVSDGFPIINGYRRLIGYIGTNELEHALAIVADQADTKCHFHPVQSAARELDDVSVSSSAYSSAYSRDPFDFTPYMDRAPLTIQAYAPLELVQQLFVKVGARYVVVTDSEGRYEGIINKTTWIAFLGELEEHAT